VNGLYFGWDVLVRRFDSLGAPRGAPFKANTNIFGEQLRSDISMDSDGDFIVVWADLNGQDGDGRGLFGQFYDLAGAANGSEFQVNQYTTNFQDNVAVAIDAQNSGFVVVWQGGSTFDGGDQDGNDSGIFGLRFTTQTPTATPTSTPTDTATAIPTSTSIPTSTDTPSHTRT
jgi:hypothetical protein